MSHSDEESAIEQYEREVERHAALQALEQKLGAQHPARVEGIPAPPWLVPGFIQEEAMHLIHAAEQSCKTWLALQLMVCGGTGQDFLGMPLAKSFDTLYLGADSPGWDLGGQSRALRGGLAVPPLESSSPSRILPHGMNLLNPSHMEVLIAYFHAYPSVKLFVLDVLLYAYAGADENSNSEMSLVYASLKRLRDECGVAILLLHHWKKDSETFRGAGTLTQAVEHWYSMKKNGDAIEMKRGKVRGDADWTELRLKLVRNESGKFLESVGAPQHPILELLCFGNRTRAELRDWAKEQGHKQDWLRQNLARLKKAGLLVEDGNEVVKLTKKEKT